MEIIGNLGQVCTVFINIGRCKSLSFDDGLRAFGADGGVEEGRTTEYWAGKGGARPTELKRQQQLSHEA